MVWVQVKSVEKETSAAAVTTVGNTVVSMEGNRAEKKGERKPWDEEREEQAASWLTYNSTMTVFHLSTVL